MTVKKASAKKQTRKKAAPKKAAAINVANADVDDSIDALADDEIVYDPGTETDDAFGAEEKRRLRIREEMAINQDQIDALRQQVDALAEKNQALLLELYPQQNDSDSLATAVRGYVKSAIADRQRRVEDPVRLAALLDQVTKAPIDAAMVRRRRRGTMRPQRPQKAINSEA